MNRIAVTIRNGNNVYVPVPDVLTWQPESGGPRLLLYDYEAGDDTVTHSDIVHRELPLAMYLVRSGLLCLWTRS